MCHNPANFLYLFPLTRLFLKILVFLNKDDFSIILDISDLAPGIYFIKSKTKAGDSFDILMIK